jgi:hypothetical protein
VYAAAAVVTTAALAKVGLTPDDVPNLRVLDAPGHHRDDNDKENNE